MKLSTQKDILCSAPSASASQPPFIILCRAPSPLAAEDGRRGGLVDGDALCRDHFCFWVRWKIAWWLQVEKNNVIGYKQFSATTLESQGFISATAAELLCGSGPSCIAHSPSSHVGTEPGEDSVTRAISGSTHKVLPNTSGVEKRPEVPQACRRITCCLCFSLASLGHGSQLPDIHS